MPPKLPLTYREIHRKLLALDFAIDHIRGSHVYFRHIVTGRRVTVVKHTGELKKGTVKSAIRQSGIDIDTFLNA